MTCPQSMTPVWPDWSHTWTSAVRTLSQVFPGSLPGRCPHGLPSWPPEKKPLTGPEGTMGQRSDFSPRSSPDHVITWKDPGQD